MTILKGIDEEGKPRDCYTVTSVNWQRKLKLKHLKSIVLDKGMKRLLVPLSACVGKGDTVRLSGAEAWVICRNGEIRILQPYTKRDIIAIGGSRLNVLIKEITELEEYLGYKSLAEYHYRDSSVHGRTSRLIIRACHPLYPKVLGYIELASPFYMNKPRANLMDECFSLNGVSWTNWDRKAMKDYTNVVARISRCVVYPEFRGLGLGQTLVKHAFEFARSHWQVGGLMPYFMEISADMLKYVPFARKAGMSFIGETQGNLSRIYKDMKYLTKNAQRVRAGEIVSEQSFGIVDQQVARMERVLQLIEREGLTRGEMLGRLKRLSKAAILKDFALFHNILSLPKPTFIKGLYPESEVFVENRIQRVPPQQRTQQTIEVEPITGPIIIKELTLTFESKVRRTQRTHAVQQAFGISPDSINNTVVNNLSTEIGCGEVILITGPSGSGKTTLLEVLAAQTGSSKSAVTGQLEVPSNFHPGKFEEIRSRKPLIEVLQPRDVSSALHLMGLVGLSDAFIFLKRFDELSKGQQYRAMLALLISNSCNVWLIDEFCSNLDSVTANVVADRLQKTARKLGATVIAAAPHCEMFVHSFKPDKVILLTSAWEHSVLTFKEFGELIPKPKLWGSQPQSIRVCLDVIKDIYQNCKQIFVQKGYHAIKPGLLIFEYADEFLAVEVTGIEHKRTTEIADWETCTLAFDEELKSDMVDKKNSNELVTIVHFNLPGLPAN